MTLVALIRHGPTDWNAAGRIQGHADRPLSSAGRTTVAGWSLPGEIAHFLWASSPLRRAVETAGLLGAPLPVATDARLIEMDWGEWEGERLGDLRARLGDTLAANEAQGLDFRPAGGESPRDVQHRAGEWLAAVAATGHPHVAVTHKGVIRAVYAAATGWDMTADPADRLDWTSAHLFRVDPSGRPAIVRLNLPLAGP